MTLPAADSPSTVAAATPPAPGEIVDLAHYYAFLLDAFARFPAEGLTIRPFRFLPFLAGSKPVAPVLDAVARRLKAEQPAVMAASATILEFGVWRGFSINRLARRFPQAQIHGFDSFEGFPDDGRLDWKLDFAVDGLPKVRRNVRLVKGFFSDTLPGFVAALPAGAMVDLMHVDCDIYSSTATIFDELGARLGPGSVIVFDELVNYLDFPENEFLAFYRFLLRADLDFEWYVKVGSLYPFDRFCSRDRLRGDLAAFRKHGHYQNVAVRLVPAGDRSRRIAAHLKAAKRLARMRPLRQPLVEVRLPPKPPGLRAAADGPQVGPQAGP
ncbi:class I SAM-dependent methyltransferase [Methylobrevis albus]|uniref:Class I SAM-dependent methyltransferase n=1 Tax=Methylobrevis albus TaxID=2793297 RepID=A0A931MZL0_9HYPH|nr:class I SAM-dependent methyltransferase [Methylobrevis albus]MBH0239557.1 class I SAM-dependent methyltransferase [Methylobrevis albus]